jgi:LacI family transcriptional regulator
MPNRVTPKMSRISEVADRAGVSAMTVSRVLNNSGYVRAATRQRVELAIAEVGYVPNALARQLRSKRTKMLALVLSDISNPFFTTIARGVEDAASARGFAVMFCNTDESDEEESRYLRLLVERQVDGVLLVPAQNAAASLRLLRTHNIPVVVLDRRASRRVDNVRCDSEEGAHALACHLVALGHRRIAVLTGRRGISTSADRVAGVRRALAEAGLALDDLLVRYGGFNFGNKNLADGRLMAQEVLTATDDPPTAIFAANNFIAFGAVRALRDLGLKVPDDISVVAFDDLPVEWVAEPFLTVAAQPAYDIGRRAAELMIDRLEGERTAAGESVVLPFELIVRRSTAAPRVRPTSPPMKAPADDVATRHGEGELPVHAVRVP